MNKGLLLAIAIVSFAVKINAQCPSCSPGDATCFWVPSVQLRNWNDAEAYCAAQCPNAHLASITSQEDNDRIVDVIKNLFHYWIGVKYGETTWSDGTPVTFTKWNDEIQNNGHCAYIKRRGASDLLNPSATKGLWVSDDCNDVKPFVCKVVLIPPTTTTTTTAEPTTTTTTTTTTTAELTVAATTTTTPTTTTTTTTAAPQTTAASSTTKAPTTSTTNQNPTTTTTQKPTQPTSQVTTVAPLACNFCPCGTASNLYQPDGCPICNRCSTPSAPAPSSCPTCPSTPTTTHSPVCPECQCGRTSEVGSDGCCKCKACPTPASTCNNCATPAPTCPACACGSTGVVGSNKCLICNQCTANTSGQNTARSGNSCARTMIGVAATVPLLMLAVL